MAAMGAGDRLGQYALRREIGRGSMATVYEAEHVALSKRFALKCMHPHLATDRVAATRFLREGKAASQIRSPHVVEVFDVGIHEGNPYLVMELLDGVDLAAWLRERQRVGSRELADLMLPLVTALHAAHQAGVVHRDLKPSNVFLARRDGGHVATVILDFGISKLLGDVNDDPTASAVLLGTVHYMSPEQTRAGKMATPLSDQYAIGVILYECLTGSKPFSGSTPYAVMHAIVSKTVSPPSAMVSGLPAALDDVVLRAMHRDPQRRFSSVRALGAALLPWASPEARERYAAALGYEGSTTVAARLSKRGRVVATFAVAVAVSFVLGAGLLHARADRAAAASTQIPNRATASSSPSAEARRSEIQPDPEPPAPTASNRPETDDAAPRQPTMPRLQSAPPLRERSERGTNGALIVE